MGRVLVIPGCMGTQLRAGSGTGPIFWADRALLARYSIFPMKLDGTEEGNPAPSAEAMAPHTPMPDYYDSGMDELTRDLAETGFLAPLYFPYDWRQSLTKTAALLVARIEAEYATGGPVTLVGHSQGGLIARLAYYTLNGQGKGSHVYRIICLGTPHQGTCRVVRAFQGEAKEGYLFATVKFWSGGIFQALEGYEGALVKMINTFMTWPAFYDLLPVTKGDGSARDQLIKQFYTKEFYRRPGVYPSFPEFLSALATGAKSGAQAFLADGVSVPRGRKLCCVVGRGWPTWDVFGIGRESIIPTAFLTQTQEGDGTVTVESASYPGSEIIVCDHPHDRLFKSLAESGQLKAIITDNWQPTVDTPPPKKEIHMQIVNDTIQQMPLKPSDIPGRKRSTARRK